MQRDSLDFKKHERRKTIYQITGSYHYGDGRIGTIYRCRAVFSSGTGLGVMLWQRSIYPPLFL